MPSKAALLAGVAVCTMALLSFRTFSRASVSIASSRSPVSLRATRMAPMARGGAAFGGVQAKGWHSIRMAGYSGRFSRRFTSVVRAEDKEDEPIPPPPEDFAKTELRVGKIVDVWPHPEADKLWCELIDLADGPPRQILSGLREFYSAEEMANRTVVVVANLKKSKLRGLDSQGMVLCASNEAHDKVELVSPPDGSSVGERVSLQTFDVRDTPPANAKKKGNSVWRSVAPFMRTNADGVATYNGIPLVTEQGPLTASLKDCQVA
ncbi:hypothetical protein AAMO2058_001704500 [Amorphochlora amoebiformis]